MFLPRFCDLLCCCILIFCFVASLFCHRECVRLFQSLYMFWRSWWRRSAVCFMTLSYLCEVAEDVSVLAGVEFKL
uniref:Uncharacterized protein n=1 Tax=Triticum urartu TaxID=4572 RepID=A0A8R7R0Q9_TRIUA